MNPNEALIHEIQERVERLSLSLAELNTHPTVIATLVLLLQSGIQNTFEAHFGPLS